MTDEVWLETGMSNVTPLLVVVVDDVVLVSAVARTCHGQKEMPRLALFNKSHALTSHYFLTTTNRARMTLTSSTFHSLSSLPFVSASFPLHAT